MFRYNDLSHHYNPATDVLSDVQIQKILLQADQDLASRGLFGVFVLPVIYFISAALTPYAKDHPGWFWGIACCLLSSSLVRFVSVQKLKNETSSNRRNWRKVYMLTSLLTGLNWGVFAASSLHFYTSQPPNIYILYFLAAVAGGAVSSFSTWLRLNIIYMIVLLGPTIFLTFFFWNAQVGLVGILALVAGLYNIGIARKWNTSYWESLINVYLLENEVAERREAEHAAEKASIMKTEFLENMSHEMRTPLHGLLSYAKFGQDRFKDVPREKLKDYFDTITVSGSRLLVLVNDLLDLAKLDSGKMQYTFQKFDISNAISRVSLELQGLTEERQLTILQTPATPVMAVFDRTAIVQVLHNLLANAIKFSPAGATIFITCQETLIDDQPSLCIKVQDEGIGIPTNEQELIFDKFVQSSKTKTGAGGTGLGLSICRKIVEDHDGRIWAETSPTGGAVFSFTLPKNRVEPEPKVNNKSNGDL